MIPIPPRLIAYGIALLALIGAYMYWHHKVFEDGRAKGVLEGKAAQQAQCEKDKKTTEGILNDLRKKASARDSRLASQRVQYAKCIAVNAAGASGDNGAATGAGAAGSLGVPAGALYEYAHENQVYFDRLGACQEYVKSIQR
jgi:hypothetical protein